MGKAICLPNPLRPRLQPLYCTHLHSGDKEEIVCHAVVFGHSQHEAGAVHPSSTSSCVCAKVFPHLSQDQIRINRSKSLLPSRYVWRTCAYVSILALLAV